MRPVKVSQQQDARLIFHYTPAPFTTFASLTGIKALECLQCSLVKLNSATTELNTIEQPGVMVAAEF
jgi:hypothetical protein